MNIVWLTWKDLDHPQAGGAETVNEELAARLAAAGHTVTLLTGGFPGAAPRVTRRGYTVVRTGGRFTTYLTTARYYLKHRAELAPDLVIDECNTMPYFSGYYAKTRVVPLIHMLCRQIWFYQFPLPFSAIGWLVEPLYLRLHRPHRPVITISESTKRELARHGFKDIGIIRMATHLTPVTDLSSTTKYPEPTILSHGSVRPMKNTLDQVKAFEIAKRQIPTLKFILSGDTTGPYGAKVLKYIKASPYAADITVLGRTTTDQMRELMQRAHLITVTSVKEGWGLIVTEANGQGTPAVVYNVDGLRDAVRHGQTGLVTRHNTPADLAANMTELLADPARYETFRQAGWQWAQELTFDATYADFCQLLGIPTTP